MIRAAIYARYSDDKQNDRSIEDQFALCRDLCGREGMAVISTFEDRAISGAGAITRPGFQAMMRAAEAHLFDVIVSEDMDRLFRDQADYHNSRKHLDHFGVAIHTASGKVGKLDGALRALMGEMYIENLAIHTRRGLEGVIRDGRHAGGRAYGYRAVPGKPGELEIVDEEAEVVRQIFADYIAGKTPRQIAHDLNKRGVRPARGRLWSASTINGNPSRGGGMILNDLYAGRIVWNKVRMIKDPVTRKRLSRPNPKDQYKIVEAPHLRIVDEETFRAAQAIKAERRRDGTPAAAQKARMPKRVFSGLVRCGCCGGGMSSNGSDRKGVRIQCSTYKESGSCTNGRRVYLNDIEALAVKGLRQHLAHPDAIAVFVDSYNAERKRLKKEANTERARLERRLGEIGREMNRIVDSIVVTGMPPEQFVARMQQLEAEKTDVTARLESAKEADNVIALHPKAIDRYKRAVFELADELKRGTPAEFATIRELVTAIIVHASPSRPGGAGTKASVEDDRSVRIDIKGRLAALCDAPTLFPNMAMSGGIVGSGGALPPVFRRGVSILIGLGVRSVRFNAISDLKGSRRRRWGSLFDQHSHALIANTLLATYLDEVLAAKFQALKKLNAWLQQQMDELRERTVAATAAVEQFKSQTELTDSDRGALENIAKLRDLESVAQGYRAIYDNFVHRYAETMQTSSPTVEARVITPAIPPGLKSWPKPAVILPATAFLGAAFGIPHRWLDYF